MVVPDTYVFTPPPAVALLVAGSTDKFAVRRIYCVGRNYAAHIREMGGDEREPPFFFQKPRDAIVLNGSTVPYPPFTQNFQHEIELVLALGRGGVDIARDAAAAHIFGMAAGVDLTRRDVQVEARDAGRPWEIGKAFDHSAPVGMLCPLAEEPLPTGGAIGLWVNGEVKQHGDLAEMIWKPAEIISYLSRQYRLEPGDLIYTGTPAGVGPIKAGDRVDGRIEGVGTVFFFVR